MTFAVLHFDHSDVVASYETFEEAALSVARYAQAHPELTDEIGVATFDDAGNLVGETCSAREILGSDEALARTQFQD
jgi:hypothetical protein